MTAFVALFRAINVGGRAKVAMTDLRKTAGDLGLGAVATILQTGNLIFDADIGPATLEATLEAAVADRLGLKADVIVRSASDWAALMAANPFAAEAVDDPAHLVVMSLKDKVKIGADAALRAAVKGTERVAVLGTTAYFVYPDGIGTSKLTPSLIERRLGVAGTGRNWNTALKIAAALADRA